MPDALTLDPANAAALAASVQAAYARAAEAGWA